MAMKRIQKELKDLTQKPDDNFTASIVSQDDLFHWKAQIKGPIGSPYEGSLFYLNVHFPSDYHFKPMKVVFLTKIIIQMYLIMVVCAWKYYIINVCCLDT